MRAVRRPRDSGHRAEDATVLVGVTAVRAEDASVLVGVTTVRAEDATVLVGVTAVRAEDAAVLVGVATVRAEDASVLVGGTMARGEYASLLDGDDGPRERSRAALVPRFRAPEERSVLHIRATARFAADRGGHAKARGETTRASRFLAATKRSRGGPRRSRTRARRPLKVARCRLAARESLHENMPVQPTWQRVPAPLTLAPHAEKPVHVTSVGLVAVRVAPCGRVDDPVHPE